MAKATEPDNDYGFSIEFQHDKTTDIDALIDQKNKDLDSLRAMITPFLTKLANSEGDIIKWPNRKEQVLKFLEKIDKHTDEAIARK